MRLTGRLAKTREEKPLSWQELKVFAFGRLKLHPWDFYEYTFEEFLLASRGFRTGVNEQMEMVRMMVWGSIAPHSPKKITPQSLFALPGDKKPVYSIDRAMAIKKRLLDLGYLSDN